MKTETPSANVPRTLIYVLVRPGVGHSKRVREKRRQREDPVCYDALYTTRSAPSAAQMDDWPGVVDGGWWVVVGGDGGGGRSGDG